MVCSEKKLPIPSIIHFYLHETVNSLKIEKGGKMKRVRICDRRYYPVLEKSVLHAERVIKRMRRNDVARDSELEGMALNGSGGWRRSRVVSSRERRRE